MVSLFEIDYSYFVDSEGDHFVTPEMGDAILKQTWDQYNAKYGTKVGPLKHEIPPSRQDVCFNKVKC